MSEATSKGGLSRFSVSRSSKQTDRKLLINNDQGVLCNQIYKLHNKAIHVTDLHFLQNIKIATSRFTFQIYLIDQIFRDIK